MRTVRCSGRRGRGCLPRGSVRPGGCTPPWTQRQTPPPTVNRILDTRLWKHYLFTTTLVDGNYLVSPGSWFNNIHLPSESTSLIISCNSASVGFCPNDLITVPSSFDVMVPSPSLSNKEKASLNSEKYIKMFFIFDAHCKRYMTCKAREHNVMRLQKEIWFFSKVQSSHWQTAHNENECKSEVVNKRVLAQRIYHT